MCEEIDHIALASHCMLFSHETTHALHGTFSKRYRRGSKDRDVTGHHYNELRGIMEHFQ